VAFNDHFYTKLSKNCSINSKIKRGYMHKLWSYCKSHCFSCFSLMKEISSNKPLMFLLLLLLCHYHSHSVFYLCTDWDRVYLQHLCLISFIMV